MGGLLVPLIVMKLVAVSGMDELVIAQAGAVDEYKYDSTLKVVEMPDFVWITLRRTREALYFIARTVDNIYAPALSFPTFVEPERKVLVGVVESPHVFVFVFVRRRKRVWIPALPELEKV